LSIKGGAEAPLWLRKGRRRDLKIDVIIPVYRPGRELFSLLDRLGEQTMSVHRIILMNTEKSFLEELLRDTGTDLAKAYGNVEVHHLSREEFDHGGTRHAAVQFSDAEIFVLMTQDAMPTDKFLIEKLTARLRAGLTVEEETVGPQGERRRDLPSARVAAAYGRQLPAANSSDAEKVSRYFNYPPKSRVKTEEDLPEMGIKTFFCSNVCAAYRRDIYEESGGFVRHTIFNEDMIYAAGVIRAGYGIAYEAQARVVHSHNYTNLQQLRRNFDLGVSQAEHPEVFARVPSEAEGKRLVKETFRYLKRRKKLHLFPDFCVQCCFKYAGYLLGRNYKKLPGRCILFLTGNRNYWK